MEYSIVIPVFNSEKSLEELHTRVKAAMEKISGDVEIIFVDDFSKDKSWDILLQIKAENPQQVKLFRLGKNFGQHSATLCGFQNSIGNRIATLDDDLQHSPEDISLLVARMDATGADVVYGISSEKFKLKRLSREIYKKGSQKLEGAMGEGSSFRLIKRHLAERILAHDHQYPFIEEILYWYTRFVEFVPVTFQPRKHGKSNYSPKNTLSLLKGNTLNYSNWPLKMMMVLGGIFSFIFFLVGIFYIFKKLFLGVSVPGFTALIVSICFTASLMLLCFGVLGFYIKNILMRLNHHPAYFVKEQRL